MWKPDVTVAAICESQGRFLMVEEVSKSTGDTVFNQPAGHLEQGESILDAAIRETREETCCHFTPKALVGLYRHEAANGKTYIRYTFSGTASEHDDSLTLDPDITRTHWLTLTEIQALPNLRSPIVLRCLEDYLTNTHYPLDFLKEL